MNKLHFVALRYNNIIHNRIIQIENWTLRSIVGRKISNKKTDVQQNEPNLETQRVWIISVEINEEETFSILPRTGSKR